jgi:hypothetical protein
MTSGPYGNPDRVGKVARCHIEEVTDGKIVRKGEFSDYDNSLL